MTLIVEDGTGRADADSLDTMTFLDSYHAAMGNIAWAAADLDDREAAARRASRNISDAYKWSGWPLNPRVQAFSWPRINVVDGDGYSVPSDEVPDEIQRAVAIVALKELESPGAMAPEFNASEALTRETYGPVTFEYSSARTDPASVRPVLLAVKDLVGPFLKAGTGSRLAGKAVRG